MYFRTVSMEKPFNVFFSFHVQFQAKWVCDTRHSFMHFLFTFRKTLLFKADYVAIKVHALPIPIMMLALTLPIELQEQTKSLLLRIENAEIMYILYELNTNNSIFTLPTVWLESLACHFTIARIRAVKHIVSSIQLIYTTCQQSIISPRGTHCRRVQSASAVRAHRRLVD